MSNATTRLQQLRPSRKKLRPGDVFAMRLPDDRYLSGRVISTEAKIGPMEGVILIYIYDFVSNTKGMPDAGHLKPDRLLVPPVMTNRLPWSRGLFEVIGHIDLRRDDTLAQHCFWSDARRVFYDEANNELPGPSEPVGEHGLDSFRTIDDKISDALGLGRAPE